MQINFKIVSVFSTELCCTYVSFDNKEHCRNKYVARNRYFWKRNSTDSFQTLATSEKYT